MNVVKVDQSVRLKLMGQTTLNANLLEKLPLQKQCDVSMLSALVPSNPQSGLTES